MSNVYNSIVFETEWQRQKYILLHGEWLKIKADYYETITSKISDIEIEENRDYDENRANSFPDRKYNEGQYNKDLANSKEECFLLDQQNFRASVPENNPIEPCDVFTRNKELIHVKRYNGSSSLSHLLAQGIVSANQLVNVDFRNHINEQISEDVINQVDPIKETLKWYSL